MNLIEDWASTLWKAWSVRLTALWAISLTYFASYPDQWVELLKLVPEGVRPLVSMAMGIAMFASTGGARVVVQKNLTKENPQ
jgi:hypothetical protein